ncbi:lipoprotein [Streptomyces sodiiphilus]|uniref:Lipoprotein n=1 Tax=Streptomyces sodiiphilus TaxID=226217 RepID=A0ABN2NX99_9ACTN
MREDGTPTHEESSVTAKKPVLAAAVAGVLAITVAGCGGSGSDGAFEGMSAQEIAEQSIEAMQGLTSLTLHATNESEEGTLEMRLSMSRDGLCTGTMALGEGETELIAVDGESYMRANDAFWESQAGEDEQDMAELVDGRWIRMPGGTGGFSESCDLEALLAELDAESLGEGAERADGEPVNGTDTVALISEEGEETRTAYVAATGEPYILRMVTEGGPDAGTATFSDFDEPVEAQAPDEEDVVDFQDLAQ